MCMVMYDNEFKTKGKNWSKDKIEPQHIHINESAEEEYMYLSYTVFVLQAGL